jgi:hypothetical protein
MELAKAKKFPRSPSAFARSAEVILRLSCKI